MDMNNLSSKILSLCLVLISLTITACAPTQSHRVIEVEKVETAHAPYSGPKSTLVVGKFENRSSYLQGLFSTNSDKLSNQAKTILKTHLQQTNRFKVVDRENMSQLIEEAKIRGQAQQLLGARYAVTGAVTEFGRKETGDKQLFGILGSSRNQIAYAKVSLNIVDVLSSEIIYSAQGAGEYQLSSREVLGFGNDASYDATLNGKVLNFAITEVVNTMVNDLEARKWSVKDAN